MISAEDFGNVCDRSTEALLSRGSESLQKDNSASVTLSLCIGNAAPFCREGKITCEIP